PCHPWGRVPVLPANVCPLLQTLSTTNFLSYTVRLSISTNIPGARSPTLLPYCFCHALYEIFSRMTVLPTATTSCTWWSCRLLRWAVSLRSLVALRLRVGSEPLLVFLGSRFFPGFLIR